MSTGVVYSQRCLFVIWLVPRETAAVSALKFCVHHTTMDHDTSFHAKPANIHRVRAYLPVTDLPLSLIHI